MDNLSPWFQLPKDQVPSPYSNEYLMAMNNPDMIMGDIPKPSVNTKKVLKEEIKAMRAPQQVPQAKSAWENIDPMQAQILNGFNARQEDLGALEKRIAGLPEKDPASFQQVNLRPLLALADQFGGTQLAQSYQAPKLDESLRNKLQDLAERKRQALADDQIKILEATNKGKQFDENLMYKQAFLQAYKDKNERNADIAETRATTAGQKDPNATVFQAAGFAKRIQQTNDIFNNLLGQGYQGMSRTDQARAYLPNEMQDPKAQQYDQATRNFINATLRRESGASIQPSEFDSAYKQYIPRPGDSPETLIQKAANRAQVFESMKTEGGNAFAKIPYVSPLGKAPKGKKLTVSNGKETLEIDQADLASAEADGFKVIK